MYVTEALLRVLTHLMIKVDQKVLTLLAKELLRVTY